MKAIRVSQFGDPSVLKLEDIPEPIPGPGQVVVELRAIGVNPVETYMRSGVYPIKPSLPYTAGADGAGVIKSVGKDARKYSAGDRVYTAGSVSGTYAQQALCEERTVFPLPKHVSFAQGAALGIPYGTAYRAVFHKAGARAGETILIHGASGAVGIAAVQLARAAGLRVIGTAGSDRGKQLVLAEGADEVLDHSQPDHFQKALALTDGRGYEAIIEMLANVNLGRDLPILAKFGRVVVVGSRGAAEITPRDAMSRDATILAMTMWNVSPEELASIHAGIFAGLENKTLRPVISREILLAQAPEAHKAVMEPGAQGKIVLIP
jgi:NADPH:quinone reductase